MFRTLIDTAKRGSGLILAALAVALLAQQVPQTLAGSSQTVDFSRLSSLQKSLFAAYQKSHSNAKWEALISSEQLEFAGATQSLDKWWQFEPMAQPRPQPGADRIAAVDEIHGQIANASSAAQYNLEVKWGGGADSAFQHAWGWGPPISVLHPGMRGFQQNKNGDPFLGVVVLFNDSNSNQGQFHIGFRGFPGHYFADNGNVARNYPSYCAWYGKIEGYAACSAASPAIGLLALWRTSR
jgi:hypothetical protein